MKLIWNYLQVTFATLGGWLGWIMGGYDGFLYALVVFVVIDYITGVMCTILEKKLSSDVGGKNGPSGSNFDFDITGFVKEWYTTGVNNGLMLKNFNETSNGNYTDFHSSDSSEGSAYRPQITIS